VRQEKSVPNRLVGGPVKRGPRRENFRERGIVSEEKGRLVKAQRKDKKGRVRKGERLHGGTRGEKRMRSPSCLRGKKKKAVIWSIKKGSKKSAGRRGEHYLL